MPLHARPKRSILVICIVAALASALGCSSEKKLTAPVPPTAGAPPIEIREDAGTYGLLAPVALQGARLDGRTLRLKVTYGGGCETHTFAAVGSTHFLASYPAQLTVFLRHDDAGDRCAAFIFGDLSFDVRPAIELYSATFGRSEPFYLRVVTPGSSVPTLVLIP